MINIGSIVLIQGVQYKVAGVATSKSFLMERVSDGKKFKCSKAQIEKFTGQAVAAVPAEANPYLGWSMEQVLAEIKNCEDALDSPENIFCDGEISRSQGMKKIAQINRKIKLLKAVF